MRLSLLAIALFWVAVLLIELLDWNLGVYKALVMVSVLGALLPLTRLAWRAQPAVEPRPEKCLAIAVGLLVAAQAAYAAGLVWHPRLTDIPATILAAGDALLKGANPYVLPIDEGPSEMDMGEIFYGFKYSPLTIVAYLPLGAPLGPRGIVLTNLLLQLATAWLVFQLARAQGTRGTGLLAALIYLTLPILPFEAFHRGVADLVATLPLLVALLHADRKPWLAGLCVGLSLSAKLLPGGLLLPCCLPTESRERLRYGAGIAVGLVPTLLAVLWSPVEVWNNLILFNLLRPMDSTSWLLEAPPATAWIARGAFVVVFLAASALMWRARAMTIPVRCGFGAVAILAALLSGPVVHNNYQLWWLPLFAVVLAAILDRRLPEPARYGDQRTMR